MTKHCNRGVATWKTRLNAEALEERSLMSASRIQSILDGRPLANSVDPLVDRIEPRMDGAIMEMEDIAQGGEAEDPVMAFDITQHRLDHMTGRKGGRNLFEREEKLAGTFSSGLERKGS
jgi:hypothetical protein